MQIYEAFREKEVLIFNFQEEFLFKFFRRCNIIKQLVYQTMYGFLSEEAKFYIYFNTLKKMHKITQ